jgi:predicted NBD/HSP70 family sugar kinase
MSARSRVARPVQPVRATRGGTQEDVRRHNLGTLLTHLHESGPLTRAELTARMELNRSTIAALVSELAALGAVGERRPDGAHPGAGRPSLMVAPAHHRVQVLAADVGVDRVMVGLVGLGGTVVARRQRRQARAAPARSVARLVGRLVDSLLADPAAGPHVVGLGVAIPGVIRQSDGCVRFAPNLGWVDEPFGEMLAERLGGLPVRIGNDADLGVLAEHRRGVARGVDDAVFLAGDVGVGGGIMVGGRPLVGAGGYAGELGHMLVRPNGRRCRCGANGCWETEIGLPAVAHALGLPATTSADVLTRALHRVGPGSGELDEIGHYLGLGMASIVNMINPRLFIVGGLLREVYPLVEPAVRVSLDAAALVAPVEQLRVVVPTLAGDATMIGASELAWTDLLADPVAVLRRTSDLRRRA